MMTRLRSNVPGKVAWTAIAALLTPFVMALAHDYDVKKLDATRFVVDSGSRNFGDSLFRLEMRRDLREVLRTVSGTDSTIKRLERRLR